MYGGLSWILIGLLAVGLAFAAVRDWRTRTIPNWLNAAIALLAIPYWWSNGLALWPDVTAQVGVASAVLALFALAFHFGAMGGGDVKMLAAVALWLPAGSVLQLLVVMSIAGGVLTLILLIPHRMARNGGQLEIPYGIAIAFAGFWVLSERFLNQFV
jgi:prepilin peptidase CpaA